MRRPLLNRMAQTENSRFGESPSDAELDLLYSVEAHVDRTFGTGQALDSRGHFHEQCFIRKTCQAVFDMDQTSMDILKNCVGLCDDKKG